MVGGIINVLRLYLEEFDGVCSVAFLCNNVVSQNVTKMIQERIHCKEFDFAIFDHFAVIFLQ